jgi:hypothetical protein
MEHARIIEGNTGHRPQTKIFKYQKRPSFSDGMVERNLPGNVQRPERQQANAYPSIVSAKTVDQYWEMIRGLARRPSESKTSGLGVPLRDMRQPENVVVVGQACFGVLSAGDSICSGIERLETGGLGSCVSLIFTDPGWEIVLAHVDSERVGSLQQVIPEGRSGFHVAIVAFSQHYDRDTLKQVEAFALLNADRVHTFHLGDDHAVGVGIDGRAYRISDTVIRPDGTYYIKNAYIDREFLPKTKDELRRVLSKDPNFRRTEIQKPKA